MICQRYKVIEILDYHNRNHKSSQRLATHQKVLELLYEMPDNFEYDKFMSDLYYLVHSNKFLNAFSFYNGFKERMRKYRKGQDYKTI